MTVANASTIATAAGMVGNLVDDPLLRFSATGKAWVTFRLAVKPYLAGATEQPEPVYYSVVCFGTLAEHVCETCHKGSRVVVSGRLEEDSWTGRDGVERVTEKIIADGIGLDLRFAEQSNKPEPAKAKTVGSSPLADKLLGPAPSQYDDEPF
jgi:single-strand DNA-binding protein